jgi:hypothetical protein
MFKVKFKKWKITKICLSALKTFFTLLFRVLQIKMNLAFSTWQKTISGNLKKRPNGNHASTLLTCVVCCCCSANLKIKFSLTDKKLISKSFKLMKTKKSKEKCYVICGSKLRVMISVLKSNLSLLLYSTEANPV